MMSFCKRAEGCTFISLDVELRMHSGLVLKLAMHCSTASSLLVVVWPPVICMSNLILGKWGKK